MDLNESYLKFYPELEKAGGLSNAINLELEKINSKFRYDGLEVSSSNKFSQVDVAGQKKLFMTDFWRDGVCLAHGGTSNISELARAIDFWLSSDVSIEALKDKFKFVEANQDAKAYDEEREVEYKWNRLLGSGLGLDEFIKVAIKDDLLTKLFPYTSLYTLRFSRCTGFPYSSADLPNVTQKRYAVFAMENYHKYRKENQNENADQIFVVTRNGKEYLGEGSAEAALKIVRDNLPANIKPAIKGTAEDLIAGSE